MPSKSLTTDSSLDNTDYTNVADLPFFTLQLRTLEAEMNDLARQLSEARRDNDELKLKYQTDVDRLQGELETCLQELQCIMDAKLSLELEICCYRQLLEGEENRWDNRDQFQNLDG